MGHSLSELIRDTDTDLELPIDELGHSPAGSYAYNSLGRFRSG